MLVVCDINSTLACSIVAKMAIPNMENPRALGWECCRKNCQHINGCFVIGNLLPLNRNTKRLFDLLLSFVLLLMLFLPILLIALLVKLTSKGPVFYISDRIGVQNRIFKMYKFRTMETYTPPVATHLLRNPHLFWSPIGELLRKTSIDELPQLFNILKGDMSFVGPRPALFNQNDLIELRTQKGIHKLVPGLTGWAQINGRDDLPIPKKVEYDEHYLKHLSFIFDLKIIFMTFFKVIRSEGVKH